MKQLLDKLAAEHGIVFTPEEREALLMQNYTIEQEEDMAESAVVAVEEIGLGKTAVAALLMQQADAAEAERVFGGQVGTVVRGLQRVNDLYKVNTSLETENFRNLLLTLAEDVRVVLIIIAGRTALMRRLNTQTDSDYRRRMARETSLLYTPLAHRLGLYAIKTEFEDLSLKFTEYDTYKQIAHALNDTKRHRDAYIDSFITPLKEKLEQMGFRFSIKGRTKSIHSIYKKMLKQQTDINHIYDLFAIRIILDSEPEKEKAECWQVYSVIADMYQPNPKRLRDWLTIPKSNGYESLHTTVLGPENKWVEVQIRTRRMDEIAEKGVAAHWKYKGIRSEGQMDDFLKSVREMLENPDVETHEALSDFRLSMYDHEVYVFTPNGDLHRLPKGVTVLDFAFAIHSGLGCRGIGGRIGNHNVPIRHVLHNGDQVEILSSPNQHPTQAWLNFVCTSKARNKIRQALKEEEYKQAADGRELLERRLNNWKLEYDEANISRLSKKAGYKSVSDFYQAVAQGREDLLTFRDRYSELLDQQLQVTPPEAAVISAAGFVSQIPEQDERHSKADVLVIDSNLRGVDYKLAKCCNPIYGDEVFGFVSTAGGIKIHRADCPNAHDMRERFPYRVIPVRWSGKAVGQQYPITLRIVGKDDIGIVTNITSLINKEQGVLLRTISIDSHDGLFEGHLTLLVSELTQLEQIRKKLSAVRGVKSCERRM